MRLAALWCIHTSSRFRQLLSRRGPVACTVSTTGRSARCRDRCPARGIRLREGEPLGYVLAVGEADVDAHVDRPVGDVAEVVDRHPVDVADVGDVLVDDLDEDDSLRRMRLKSTLARSASGVVVALGCGNTATPGARGGCGDRGWSG